MKLATPVIALTLLLGACSGDTDHNKTDVAFAQQMVPHHEQAIEMARMVDDADAGADVRMLAADIARAQGPEIRAMRGWLDDWDADSPQGHGGMKDMDGMMSGSTMKQLDTATGPTFDRLWLESMIEHHEGAVTMAEREMRNGEYSQAIDLAHDITRTQVREIDHMKELLDD